MSEVLYFIMYDVNSLMLGQVFAIAVRNDECQVIWTDSAILKTFRLQEANWLG